MAEGIYTFSVRQCLVNLLSKLLMNTKRHKLLFWLNDVAGFLTLFDLEYEIVRKTLN